MFHKSSDFVYNQGPTTIRAKFRTLQLSWTEAFLIYTRLAFQLQQCDPTARLLKTLRWLQ